HAVWQRVGVGPGSLRRRLVVLSRCKDERTSVFQRGGRHGISGVPRIQRCPSLVISGLWAAGDGTAMTTVEDERQRDSLLQQGAEESRQLLVPDVEYSRVGVRRHNRLVVPRRLGPAVDALGAVAGVVEDDDIPRLRIRNELLDRADDMLAR